MRCNGFQVRIALLLLASTARAEEVEQVKLPPLVFSEPRFSGAFSQAASPHRLERGFDIRNHQRHVRLDQG